MNWICTFCDNCLQNFELHLSEVPIEGPGMRWQTSDPSIGWEDHVKCLCKINKKTWWLGRNSGVAEGYEQAGSREECVLTRRGRWKGYQYANKNVFLIQRSKKNWNRLFLRFVHWVLMLFDRSNYINLRVGCKSCDAYSRLSISVCSELSRGNVHRRRLVLLKLFESHVRCDV